MSPIESILAQLGSYIDMEWLRNMTSKPYKMLFAKHGTPQCEKVTQKKGSWTKVKGHNHKIPIPFGENICTESTTGSLWLQNTSLHTKTAACGKMTQIKGSCTKVHNSAAQIHTSFTLHTYYPLYLYTITDWLHIGTEY